MFNSEGMQPSLCSKIIGLFICGIPFVCQAADKPLAVDTFANDRSSYPITSKLSGREPTSAEGFIGPWSGAVTNVIMSDAEANLDFGPLLNDEGSIQVRYPAGTISRMVYRSLDSVKFGDDLWFSVLTKASQQAVEGGLYASIGLLSGEPKLYGAASLSSVWPSGLDATLAGFTVGVKDGAIVLKIESNFDGESREDVLLEKVVPDQTYLIVVRLSPGKGKSARFDAWVCTEFPADAAGLGPSAISLDSRVFMKGRLPGVLAIFAQGNIGFQEADNRVWFDAFRLGGSLDSVLPK